MAMRAGSLGWAVGKGMTRPILAYLVIVTLGAWIFGAVQLVQQGGDLVDALVVTAATLLEFGTVWLAFLLLIPAMVLTIELIHRFEATSRAARAGAAAASWAGWGLFVAITLAVASRVVLVPEWVAGDLLLFAASGAAFSLLAFDGWETRSGKALALLALAVTALVVLGGIWMAGRWGSAA